ncbi:MAG TPA: BON domain-containing protein [Planctomycetaceae bacterium]|nr:BON domain-containing protein [Planctomycetaceae bacterium]
MSPLGLDTEVVKRAANPATELAAVPTAVENSPADLDVRILRALRETHLPELASITVELRFGRIYLRGTVSSYYAKQSAQSAARRMESTLLVVNLIQVVTQR